MTKRVKRKVILSIFVTGGAGFIGSQFIRDWLACHPDQPVINFDALTYAGNLDNLADAVQSPAYRFVQGDICDPDSVAAALPTGCDAVIHFAAESHVDRSIRSAGEFVRTNVLGTQVLLDAARIAGVKRFLHISTDEVGGSMKPGQWFAEDGALAPSSPYAASKAAAEHLVNAAHYTFGLNTVVTRTSNNYGPYQFPEKLLPLAICNLLEGRPVPIYGDGQQERDWIHVADNARALRAVLDHGRPGATYHISAQHPRSNREVLSELLKVTGCRPDLLQPVADRPGHDRRYAVDCRLIMDELHWRPEIPFEEGLRETVAWYSTHQEWVKRIQSGVYRTYYREQYGELLSA